MKRAILISVILFIRTFPIFGQQITGTVLDSISKLPIEGATVSWKISGLTSVTEKGGAYSLAFINPDTLMISVLGYQNKQVYVNTAGKVNVELVVSQSMIDEVSINTGYYQISPERAAGPFAEPVADTDVFSGPLYVPVVQRTVPLPVLYQKLKAGIVDADLFFHS